MRDKLIKRICEQGYPDAKTAPLVSLEEFFEGNEEQVKYLNNIVEQDHRFIKNRLSTMLGLKAFCTAKSIISGIEAMHMMKKKQVYQEVKSVQNEVKFIHQLFGIAS